MPIYGYCIGVWLVLRQGRIGMAMVKARVQGCGYVVGLWCRGRCRAMVMAMSMSMGWSTAICVGLYV